MRSFQWSLPTQVIFGEGRFKNIGKHLKGLGKKAFVITSESFAPKGPRNSHLKHLQEQLSSLGVECRVFAKIPSHPKVSVIDEAAASARDFNANYIIALGGGSVMDAAKCVALLCKNEGSAWDYAYKGNSTDRKKFNSALPLVAIPTIPASGSETNFFSVITQDHLTNSPLSKSIVFGFSLQPKIAVIDPAFTQELPWVQTVDSGFDIITHCLETYFSSIESYRVEDELSLALVSSVIKSLAVLKNEKDPQKISEARSDMSYAASLPLCGFLSGRSGGWPIHALEHGMSAFDPKIPHGRGLAFLLPRIILFNLPRIEKKILHLNEIVFQIKTKNVLESLDQGLFQFMKTMGAWWGNLNEFGVLPSQEKDFIPFVLEHTFRIDAIHQKEKAQPFLENIIPIFPQDASEILQKSMQ